MEIEAHSLHADASTEIPKIDEKELGRALRQNKPIASQLQASWPGGLPANRAF
jgi:hypothetical protein